MHHVNMHMYMYMFYSTVYYNVHMVTGSRDPAARSPVPGASVRAIRFTFSSCFVQ